MNRIWALGRGTQEKFFSRSLYFVPQLRPVSPFLPIICLLPAEGCVVCLVVVVRPSVNDRWASRRSAIRSTRPIELATSVGEILSFQFITGKELLFVEGGRTNKQLSTQNVQL